MDALLAATPLDPIGGYFSPVKIVVMLVLALPWLYLSPWAQKDAVRVGLSGQLLGGLVLGAGALGMFLWMMIPTFGIGMVVYAVLVLATALSYVIFRNTRVPAGHRLLTSAHLSGAFKSSDSKKVKAVTRVKVYDAFGHITAEPDDTASVEEKLSYNATQELLYDLLFYRASEADLAPTGDEAVLRFVVDGVLAQRPSLDIADSERVIQLIKGLAGLDVDEHRKPQQGQVSVDLVNQPIDLVVTTAGTTSGQRLQMRVIQESIQTRLPDLGMPEDVLAAVTEANRIGPGLIVVSSRPKNGLTSTLYSLLRCHDAYTMHLATLEAKIASELENVAQQAYKGDADAQRKMLATALRQEPHVVMIDACKDAATAQAIAQAAQDRLILLGINASDSFSALAKWVKICGDATVALTPLKLVLSQALVRILCPECREAYRPDPALIAKANLNADQITELYRPPTKPRLDEKGKPLVDVEGNPIPCPGCRGTGYYGRTGVFEHMAVTDELRQLVIAGESLNRIKASCRKNKMLYLQEQALRKVTDNVTSIQEVIRVTQPSGKPKKQ